MQVASFLLCRLPTADPRAAQDPSCGPDWQRRSCDGSYRLGKDCRLSDPPCRASPNPQHAHRRARRSPVSDPRAGHAGESKTVRHFRGRDADASRPPSDAGPSPHPPGSPRRRSSSRVPSRASRTSASRPSSAERASRSSSAPSQTTQTSSSRRPDASCTCWARWQASTCAPSSTSSSTRRTGEGASDGRAACSAPSSPRAPCCRLFEMGFAEQLSEILGKMPQQRQTLIVSATLPKALAQFAQVSVCAAERARATRVGRADARLM